MAEITAYPLQWPTGWKRAEERKDATFQCSFETNRRDLERELRLLDAENIVVSSNIPVRSDGLPYADWARRRIDDPGVAVYFHRKGRAMRHD